MLSSGFSIWHILVTLVVVILVFGTKKLRDAGGDLGTAIKEFKKALGSDADNKNESSAASSSVNKNDSPPTDQPKSS